MRSVMYEVHFVNAKICGWEVREIEILEESELGYIYKNPEPCEGLGPILFIRKRFDNHKPGQRFYFNRDEAIQVALKYRENTVKEFQCSVEGYINSLADFKKRYGI